MAEGGQPRLAVIGAGSGGLAVAAYAGLRGWSVAICDRHEERIARIREVGSILVTGRFEGTAPIALASTDVGRVLRGAELVAVVVDGRDVADAFSALSSHVEVGQVLVAMPGGTGGALTAAASLPARKGVVIAETDSFPFGCAVPSTGCSSISSMKRSIAVAALPQVDTVTAVEATRRLFPQVVAASSVLETSLANFNAVLHVAPMVCNAGRIEAGPSFEFYGEGFTPAVVRLVEAYDRERLRVAGALGVPAISVTDWFQSAYDVSCVGVGDAIEKLSSTHYRGVTSPSSLKHRFLSEDVPCGSVPTAELGRRAGVDTPVHDLLIELASSLCGEDWRATGRNSARLGIEQLDAAGLRGLAAT